MNSVLHKLSPARLLKDVPPGVLLGLLFIAIQIAILVSDIGTDYYADYTRDPTLSSVAVTSPIDRRCDNVRFGMTEPEVRSTMTPFSPDFTMASPAVLIFMHPMSTHYSCIVYMTVADNRVAGVLSWQSGGRIATPQ